jgi:hypothetical protein
MHTLGQWKIRAGYGRLMSEIGPEDRAVCTVWTKQPKYNQVTERSEPAAWAEGEANAALIAAAPEFYESATANYGGWIGPELLDAAADHCDDSAIADLLRARAQSDRAAIAKAKGEK